MLRLKHRSPPRRMQAEAEREVVNALAALLVEDVLRRPRINIRPKQPTLRLVRR